jgi:hypothetical protein
VKALVITVWVCGQGVVDRIEGDLLVVEWATGWRGHCPERPPRRQPRATRCAPAAPDAAAPASGSGRDRSRPLPFRPRRTSPT